MPRHPAIALILALILALVSLQAAVARATMAVPGLEMTLCTGDGPVTVTLDAQGNPVAHVPHCPACILAVTLPPPGVAAKHPAHRLVPPHPAAALRLPVQMLFLPTPPSRAPPLSA